MAWFLLSEKSSFLNNECLSEAAIHKRYWFLGTGQSFYLLTNGGSITEQNCAQPECFVFSSSEVGRSVTAFLLQTHYKKEQKEVSK